MPATETLTIVVRVRDLAGRGLRAVRQSLGRISNVAKLAGGAVFSLKGALLGVGGAVIARQFLQVATSFAQMELKLDQLTKGRGRQTLEEINEWAKRMPVDTQQAVNAFIQMQAYGLDPTLEKMEILTDVATVMGQDAFPRVSRALGQMAALGKLSSEELNQLGEVGINARKILTDAFGQSVEEIQKSGRDINEVIDALWAGLRGEFGGASQRALETWGGIITVLKSYWIEFVKTVADNDVFLFLKTSLQLLLEQVDALAAEGALERWAEQTATVALAAFKRIAQGAAIVADVLRIWRIALEGIRAAFALVAMYFNEGLRVIADQIDWVVNRLVQSLEFMFEKIAGAFERIQKFDPTGVIKNMATSFRAVADAVGEIGEIETGDMFEDNAEYWEDVVNESAKLIPNLMAQESYLSRTNRVLGEINKRMEETKRKQKEAADAAKEQTETTTAPRAPAAISPLSAAASELSRLQADIARGMAEIENMFETGLISAEEYYNAQVTGANQVFQAEQALLQAQLEAEKKVENQQKIQDQLYKNEQEFQTKMLELHQQRIANEKTEQDAALAEQRAKHDLHIRELIAMSGGFDMSTLFTQQILEMDAAHAEERRLLEERLKNIKDNAEKIQAVEDLNRVQTLEKDKLLTKQRIELQQQILSATSTALGDLASVYKMYYDNAEGENREHFKIYKALSIAQALIDTYQSGVTAYLRGSEIPFVGAYLGPVFAATAVAAGLARVALMRQQNYASGGEIKGYSPHSRADNIPINATAGEFMQPVAAVRHYGRGVMEAIRTRSIPREMFAGFNMPNYRVGSGNFQQGGAVNPQSAAIPTNEDQGVVINNIVDPTMVDQHIQSTPGQKSVMNVLSENQFAVKQLVLSG